MHCLTAQVGIKHTAIANGNGGHHSGTSPVKLESPRPGCKFHCLPAKQPDMAQLHSDRQALGNPVHPITYPSQCEQNFQLKAMGLFTANN